MPTSTQRLADLIRQFLTEDQNEAAPAQVVAALATVGNGHLRTSAGVGLPISKITELRQLAAYLVSHYLAGTRPSPTNLDLGQIASFIRSRLAKEQPPVVVPNAGIAALAALALGHMTDFLPPSTRAVVATQIAELYLAGR